MGGDIQVMAPAPAEAKVMTQRKRRFRRVVPMTSGWRDRIAVKPAKLRRAYNADDFRVAREIVDRYCPCDVPKGGRSRLKGPLDLFEALLVYVVVVGFNWQITDVAQHIGRSRRAIRDRLGIVEDLRGRRYFAFIDEICDLAEGYRHGLF